jgi:hypothetical protein
MCLPPLDQIDRAGAQTGTLPVLPPIIFNLHRNSSLMNIKKTCLDLSLWYWEEDYAAQEKNADEVK